MTSFEAKMLEKFSEAVEDAIARYLADKNISKNALREYFGDVKLLDRVLNCGRYAQIWPDS